MMLYLLSLPRHNIALTLAFNIPEELGASEFIDGPDEGRRSHHVNCES